MKPGIELPRSTAVAYEQCSDGTLATRITPNHDGDDEVEEADCHRADEGDKCSNPPSSKKSRFEWALRPMLCGSCREKKVVIMC